MIYVLTAGSDYMYKFSGALICGLGSSCSKLTTSLVNISLKFQMLISEIWQYFLLKKCEKLCSAKAFFIFFFNKNIIVFGNKVVKQLTG